MLRELGKNDYRGRVLPPWSLGLTFDLNKWCERRLSSRPACVAGRCCYADAAKREPEPLAYRKPCVIGLLTVYHGSNHAACSAFYV